jgi:general secretion pathway protein A
MYETHFGFTELPFNDTPDPRFFFANGSYQEAFATLCYGVERRKGLIVVTGEAGTGKSALLRKLMHDGGPNLHIAYISNSLVTFTELLKLALSDLGLLTPAADKIGMIEQLNDYSKRQLQLNNLVCLLIDEAQNLSDDTLEEVRLLSNLETENAKLLQIVLVGQPGLERRLNQVNLSQLKQRIAYRCRIWPLQAHEVEAYIETRLQAAGCKGNGLFSPEAIERIAACSEGIPRLVNLICDNALFHAFVASKSRITADIVEKVTQELKLFGKGQSGVADRVSALNSAVGRDTFRPTRKNISALSYNIDWPGHESEQTLSNTAVWPVGFDLPESRPPWRRRMAVLLGTFIVAGVVVALHSRGVTISDVRDPVDRIAGVGRGDGRMPSVNPTPAPHWQEPKEPETNAQIPEPEAVAPAEPLVDKSAAPARDASVESADRSSQSVLESRAKQDSVNTEEKRRPAPIRARTGRVLGDESAAHRLKLEITRAIQNRAISGVDVDVRDGTVFLYGQVATERQKSAAVQATRSVSGVNQVHDRIAVGWSGGPGPKS